MKIAECRVIVTCPGRNFVTLKIITEDGSYGLGDATLNGRELAVATYLEEHVVPCLIGRDARRIEDTWQYLYRGAYWRRGPVTMTAIAAVDVALWDIKAKIRRHAALSTAGRALPRGGDGLRPRQRRGHRRDLATRSTATSSMGYHAIRAQSGVPGLANAYGVGRGQAVLRAGRRRPCRRETMLVDTPKYLNSRPSCSRRCASISASNMHLLHDVHHRLTPIEAAQLGKALEPYRLFWLEDATPAENQERFRLIRQHTTTPLAVGESVQHHLGLPRT